MGQYLPIFAMLVLALVFAGVSRVVSQLMAPRSPSVAKAAPYECGIVPSKEPPERFPVKFFLVAMIFIVFDIEIIFLFPFATVFRELGGFGIGAIVIFSAAVFESFVYLISKGALDWGPIKRLQRSDIVSPARTATTTIRRVGLEGRQPAAAEEAA
jgi:NADH-quinone oxidoreductase subunit A